MPRGGQIKPEQDGIGVVALAEDAVDDLDKPEPKRKRKTGGSKGVVVVAAENLMDMEIDEEL
jgi:hypothetical protein